MIVVVGDDPRYGLVLPNGDVDDTPWRSALEVGGYFVPWLPSYWWRALARPVPAFRIDCELQRPLWKLEIADPSLG